MKRFFSFFLFLIVVGNWVYGDLAKRKQEQWDAMTQYVSLMCCQNPNDPLDEEIKETVVALRLLGLTTVESCQGHVHKGIGAPWVSFAFPNGNVKESVAPLQKALDAFYERRNCPEDRKLWIDLEKQLLINKGEGMPVYQLESMQRERLKQYQQEMWEFTHFLKDRFLHGEKKEGITMFTDDFSFFPKEKKDD